MSPSGRNIPLNAKVIARHGSKALYGLRDGSTVFHDSSNGYTRAGDDKDLLAMNQFSSVHNSDWAEERIKKFAWSQKSLIHSPQVKFKVSQRSLKRNEDYESGDLDLASVLPKKFVEWASSWKPGDAIPIRPPGWGKPERCSGLSPNSDIYGNLPPTTEAITDSFLGSIGFPMRAPVNSRKELSSAYEKGLLGRAIREIGAPNILGLVARARGLWVDRLNKLRCLGGPAANRFTNIFGEGCNIPSSPEELARDAASAAREAAGDAARATREAAGDASRKLPDGRGGSVVGDGGGAILVFGEDLTETASASTLPISRNDDTILEVGKGVTGAMMAAGNADIPSNVPLVMMRGQEQRRQITKAYGKAGDELEKRSSSLIKDALKKVKKRIVPKTATDEEKREIVIANAVDALIIALRDAGADRLADEYSNGSYIVSEALHQHIYGRKPIVDKAILDAEVQRSLQKSPQSPLEVNVSTAMGGLIKNESERSLEDRARNAVEGLLNLLLVGHELSKDNPELATYLVNLVAVPGLYERNGELFLMTHNGVDNPSDIIGTSGQRVAATLRDIESGSFPQIGFGTPPTTNVSTIPTSTGGMDVDPYRSVTPSFFHGVVLPHIYGAHLPVHAHLIFDPRALSDRKSFYGGFSRTVPANHLDLNNDDWKTWQYAILLHEWSHLSDFTKKLKTNLGYTDAEWAERLSRQFEYNTLPGGGREVAKLADPKVDSVTNEVFGPIELLKDARQGTRLRDDLDDLMVVLKHPAYERSVLVATGSPLAAKKNPDGSPFGWSGNATVTNMQKVEALWRFYALQVRWGDQIKDMFETHLGMLGQKNRKTIDVIINRIDAELLSRGFGKDLKSSMIRSILVDVIENVSGAVPDRGQLASINDILINDYIAQQAKLTPPVNVSRQEATLILLASGKLHIGKIVGNRLSDKDKTIINFLTGNLYALGTQIESNAELARTLSGPRAKETVENTIEKMQKLGIASREDVFNAIESVLGENARARLEGTAAPNRRSIAPEIDLIFQPNQQVRPQQQGGTPPGGGGGLNPGAPPQPPQAPQTPPQAPQPQRPVIPTNPPNAPQTPQTPPQARPVIPTNPPNVPPPPTPPAPGAGTKKPKKPSSPQPPVVPEAIGTPKDPWTPRMAMIVDSQGNPVPSVLTGKPQISRIVDLPSGIPQRQRGTKDKIFLDLETGEKLQVDLTDEQFSAFEPVRIGERRFAIPEYGVIINEPDDSPYVAAVGPFDPNDAPKVSAVVSRPNRGPRPRRRPQANTEATQAATPNLPRANTTQNDEAVRRAVAESAKLTPEEKAKISLVDPNDPQWLRKTLDSVGANTPEAQQFHADRVAKIDELQANIVAGTATGVRKDFPIQIVEGPDDDPVTQALRGATNGTELSQTLKSLGYVVIDTETSGFTKSHGGSVWHLYARKTNPDGTVEVLDVHVAPTKPRNMPQSEWDDLPKETVTLLDGTVVDIAVPPRSLFEGPGAIFTDETWEEAKTKMVSRAEAARLFSEFLASRSVQLPDGNTVVGRPVAITQNGRNYDNPLIEEILGEAQDAGVDVGDLSFALDAYPHVDLLAVLGNAHGTKDTRPDVPNGMLRRLHNGREIPNGPALVGPARQTFTRVKKEDAAINVPGSPYFNDKGQERWYGEDGYQYFVDTDASGNKIQGKPVTGIERGNSLEAAGNYYGIVRPTEHTADADVGATEAILFEALRRGDIEGWGMLAWNHEKAKAVQNSLYSDKKIASRTRRATPRANATGGQRPVSATPPKTATAPTPSPQKKKIVNDLAQRASAFMPQDDSNARLLRPEEHVGPSNADGMSFGNHLEMENLIERSQYEDLSDEEIDRLEQLVSLAELIRSRRGAVGDSPEDRTTSAATQKAVSDLKTRGAPFARKSDGSSDLDELFYTDGIEESEKEELQELLEKTNPTVSDVQKLRVLLDKAERARKSRFDKFARAMRDEKQRVIYQGMVADYFPGMDEVISDPSFKDEAPWFEPLMELALGELKKLEESPERIREIFTRIRDTMRRVLADSGFEGMDVDMNAATVMVFALRREAVRLADAGYDPEAIVRIIGVEGMGEIGHIYAFLKTGRK